MHRLTLAVCFYEMDFRAAKWLPGLRFADGPPGVLTRHPAQAPTATMGVAATFSLQSRKIIVR
jgi:hypothetical protein